ncbi:hypothetical protein ACI797_27220 [Geodermatophilus sp. SYSU D00691]
MTVLMTANQSESLGGDQCRVEWQGLASDDLVTARLRTAQGTTLVFPDEGVPGLRPQPWVTNGWLLDLGALPSGWQQLDLVVRAVAAHGLSLGLEVRPSIPGGAVRFLQHPSLTTVPNAPMIALRITPGAAGALAVAYEAVFGDQEDGGIGGTGLDVPAALREAAVLARHEHLVRSGEPVTAVVDLSASMRPRLAAGTVSGVLAALQAVAAAAHRSEVSVVAVSDRVHEARPLRLTDDPEEFLRTWAQEIGFRTGSRMTKAGWSAGSAEAGLVVSVSDQEDAALPVGARSRRILLAPPGDGEPTHAAPGTVVIADARPDAASVIRALAHASPAA